MENIPTIKLPNQTEEREREIINRDNVANGEFDWDELGNSWDENLLAEWGVDVPTFEDIREDEQVENESSKEVKLCPHCGEEL